MFSDLSPVAKPHSTVRTMGTQKVGGTMKGSSPDAIVMNPRFRRALENRGVMIMFAQLHVDGKFEGFKPSFATATEKPVLKGFIISIIAGTVIGGYLTSVWLMQTMSPAALANAVAAGAAVGASAGLLLFGLFDVVFTGRLEEDCELVEEEEEFETTLDYCDDDKPEEAGQEDNAFTLPKAS